MTVVSFNSPAKQCIRSKWSKPLLKYLSEHLNKKILYLGLPDTEAHDIKEWREYIDSVYAFQCRDYPKPSDPDQKRDKVLALENTLRELERKRVLTTYDVYDGYIEEVVLRGYDNSPDQKDFFLNELVTVYNLDFCGQVTSPIEYVDKKGNKKQAYKFDAVKKLLETKALLPFDTKKFVLFLTLHCSYNGKEFQNFQNNPPNSDIENFIKPTRGLTKGARAPYWIKAFVFHNLSLYFIANNFIPEFLPVIYYLGDDDNPLLHFTVLGTKAERSGGLPSMYQKGNDFLYNNFVSLNSDGNELAENLTLNVHGKKCKPLTTTNVLTLFKQTKAYKNLWRDIK